MTHFVNRVPLDAWSFPGTPFPDRSPTEHALELARVRAREASRLLWRGALRLAGAEEGILVGVRPVVVELELQPEIDSASIEDDARRHREALARDRERDEDVEHLLARLARGEPSLEAGLDLARRAVVRHPGTVDLRRWARFEWARGAPVRAQAVLRRALDDLAVGSPDPVAAADLLTDLARLAAESGAVHQARELLLEADRTDPARADVAFDAWRLALRLDEGSLADRAAATLRRANRAAMRALPDALRRLRTDVTAAPLSRSALERVLRAAGSRDPLGTYARSIVAGASER